MTDPSLVAQTITISHNVALTAGFAITFAGGMLGYAIGRRQRRDDWPPQAEVMHSEPEVTTLVIGDLETRFRRLQT